MTKNEIYEHLARVYIGKSEKSGSKKKKYLRPRLVSQIAISVIILGIIFSGLTAFLSKKNAYSSDSIIFALNNSPIRIKYNLTDPYPQIEKFSMPIPPTDASRYNALTFSIRSLEEGSPGIVKIVLKNKKNEASFYFIEDVNLKWQRVSIPLSEFDTITDWTNLTDISFVLEAWNAEKKKGIILIEDICFAG